MLTCHFWGQTLCKLLNHVMPQLSHLHSVTSIIVPTLKGACDDSLPSAQNLAQGKCSESSCIITISLT